MCNFIIKITTINIWNYQLNVENWTECNRISNQISLHSDWCPDSTFEWPLNNKWNCYKHTTQYTNVFRPGLLKQKHDQLILELCGKTDLISATAVNYQLNEILVKCDICRYHKDDWIWYRGLWYEMISYVHLTQSVTFISTHKEQLKYKLTILLLNTTVEI